LSKKNKNDAKRRGLDVKAKELLINGEKIEMAFKCGRDLFLLTTLQMIKVDVQGMTGPSVQYFLTILWTIKAYSIETAGGFFHRDTELRLFFDIPDVSHF
jgi:hypothetical protein